MDTGTQQSDLRSRAIAPVGERICLAAAELIAAVELLAWWLPALSAHLPQGWELMKANTALGMLLVSAGLTVPQGKAWGLRLSQVCTGLLILLALVVLVEHSSGDISRFDTLLVVDHAAANLGPMSAQTAFGLLLLGFILPWTHVRTRGLSLAADVLASLLTAFVLVMLMGYVFGAVKLFGESTAIRLSPQTLACFVLLTVVVILHRSDTGVFSVLRGAHIGSRIARIAIPLGLVIPVTLVFLHAYSVTAGFITPEYGSAVSVSFISLSVTGLVLLMAWRINALERAELRESEQRYVDLVEQAIDGIIVRSPDGKILLVNAAYCKMGGYTQEEMINLRVEDLLGKYAKDVLQRTGSVKVGEPLRIETYLHRKDGGYTAIEANTLRLANGNLQSVVRDVSVRKQLEQAREESEHRYMELVEQAADAIWLRRSDGEMVFVNEAACQMLGYSREELLRSNSPQLIHPSDTDTASHIDALRPLETLRIERMLRHKNGHAIPAEASARRLEDGSIQVISRDITERKRIESARDESERRYAELVDQALEGIMVRKASGDIVFVNQSFCRMLGYSPDELTRLNIRDIVHPEDAETIQQIQRLTAGGHLRLEKRMLRKDGDAVHVEVSAKRLQSGDIQTTMQDVTEHKHAELRFRTMVEGAPNAMIMAGKNGTILLANPQAEKLFGYSREEMLGRSVEMLVPIKSRPGHPKLREGYNRDPRMRAMGVGRDLFGLRKDGSEVPVEIGLNPINTAEGRFVLASVIDITERRAAEQREHAFQDELQVMSRRLSEAQETERRAIARELHDEVGQSLTATRLNLRGLEKEAEGGPLAQRITDASSIISELLGKVRQMSLDLHPSVLDDLGLGPALRWCVRTRTTGSELQVTLDVPEDLPRFEGMAEITLFRVFQEALSNALRHSEAKHFRVQLRHPGGQLMLTMQDDGHGFDAEAARRTALSGKSLGLLGMHERARLAGGELTLKSAPGKGTEIRVTLPANER